MGFYGNITNTNRTQFQFDRIYSSRKSMDQNRISDNVYLGRYVLVEYDSDGLDGMKRIWKSGNNYYFSTDTTQPLTKQNTANNEVFYRAVEASGDNPADLTATTENEVRTARHIFYKCSHGESSITLTQINDSANQTQYTTNYNIDMAMYNGGRGYDSTVWQKVYTDESERYVMIAELNTVVPTFDIATDAPTMVPVAPHFDTQSTDVYYKLHMQNPWVVRVAEATGSQKSDSKTKWVTVNYNPDAPEGQRYSTEEIEKNAAIYFNKAAFDKQIDKASIKKTVNGDNKIVMSLATSGQAIYDDHDNTTVDPITAKDIQELTINLPAIGNMMSDAWDIIHGPLRNNARTDANSSLQGRLDSFKEIEENQIPVKRATDGTLIGSKINSALKYDDWDDKPTEILNDDGVTPEFVRDDAWIETTIDTSGLVGGVKNGDSIDQSGNSGISIHHTFHATDDSTSTLDKNTGSVTTSNKYKESHIPASNLDSSTDDTITLYTPYVDAKGHVVGKNIETITLPYGFKTIKTNGRSNEVSENATGTPSIANIVADNTQDVLAINSGNKWIRIDTSATGDSLTIRHDVHNTFDTTSTKTLVSETGVTTFDVPTYTFDEAGHYTNHDTKTITVPFGYGKIKGDNDTSTAATATYDTVTFASDEWLTATVSKDTVTYSHDYPKKVNDTTSESNVNGNGDKIVLETLVRDEKGHVTHVNQNTVTLPFSFKTITVDTESTATTGVAAAAGSVVADNTQDTLTLTPGNKWIHLTSDANNDTITVSHEVNSITTTKVSDTDLTTNTSASVTIPDWTYDEGGHIRSKQNHLYKLPFGYGQIKGDNNTSTAATATYDELSIVTGDDWLTSSVSADTVTITHDFKAVKDTTSAINKNTAAEDKDIIKLYTPYVDDKGHVVGKNFEKVTLPFGYKTFTGDSGTTSANNTQDSMSVTGDNWVKTTVTNDKIAFAHIGPVAVTATKLDDVTPKFGETFDIVDWYYDSKGHKSSHNTHTVTIPLPSLTNGTGNIVTGLSLVPSAGALTETKDNINNLLLTDYTKKSDNTDVSSADKLGEALSKLQTQIHDTEKVINDLEYSNESNQNIITKITQTDGQIAVERAAAGSLILGQATTGGTVSATDSLNSAFNAVESALQNESSRANTEETKLNNAIIAEKERAEGAENKLSERIDALIGGDLNEAFDTIQEISAWLGDDNSGADKIVKDIANLNADSNTMGSVDYKVKNAINEEVINRNNAIATEINKLDVNDTAQDGYYVSAVAETDGKITVSRAAIPTYVLTTGSELGTVSFNGANILVNGIGSAAYKSEDYFIPKEIYDRKMAEMDAAIIGINQEAKRLTNENIALAETIKQLSERLSALENQTTE